MKTLAIKICAFPLIWDFTQFQIVKALIKSGLCLPVHEWVICAPVMIYQLAQRYHWLDLDLQIHCVTFLLLRTFNFGPRAAWYISNRHDPRRLKGILWIVDITGSVAALNSLPNRHIPLQCSAHRSIHHQCWSSMGMNMYKSHSLNIPCNIFSLGDWEVFSEGVNVE